MKDPDNLRKFANCVEAIRDVDGVEVTEHEITEVPSGDMNPLAAMMGMQNPETEERLVLVIDPTEGEKTEYPEEPDNPDEEDLREDAEEIEIEG